MFSMKYLLLFQSFPTPLCFNKEKTGFEVVTEARKEIGKQIKAAIRSQKKQSKIYKVVKNHSFIDIPLIPIVEPEGPDHIEINTNYTVTVSTCILPSRDCNMPNVYI